MKPEEIRTDLAVVEWTLKQWETGALTKLEGGEPVEVKYNYARATSGNTIKGAWVSPTVAACRISLREKVGEGRQALENANVDGRRFEIIKLLSCIEAQIEADDALVLKLHNATGAR